MKTKPNGCALALKGDGFGLSITAVCDAELKPRSRNCRFFKRGTYINSCESLYFHECKNKEAIQSLFDRVGGVEKVTVELLKNLSPKVEKLIASFYTLNGAK